MKVMKESKKNQIEKALGMIVVYMKYLRPEINIEIIYDVPQNVKEKYSDWDVKYHGIYNGEEYFMIFIDDHLHYVINVTGDSTLTALGELTDLLARKF